MLSSGVPHCPSVSLRPLKEFESSVQKLDTFDMVLFGGTGDLALRKLVPALYRRHVAGQMGPDSRVLAVARSGISRDEYLTQIEASCRKHLSGEEFTDARWRSFAAQVEYVQV